MQRLSVIIVNYNTAPLTIRAAQSVLDASSDYSVFIVDNSSVDDDHIFLSRWCKSQERVSLLETDKNLGFSGGNNLALHKCTTEYCMLLNSDAYLDKDTEIETILEYMDEHSNVGMVTPLVLLNEDSIDPACHRGFPTPLNALTYFSKLEKMFCSQFFSYGSYASQGMGMVGKLVGGYHQTWKNLSEIHAVDACTGAAMVLKMSAVHKVGMLDEQFFMYGEDLDWCYRFKESGFDVVFYPGCTVYHDKHTSGLKQKKKNTDVHATTKSAFYNSMKLFYKKHYMHVYPRIITNITLFGIDVLARLGR